MTKPTDFRALCAELLEWAEPTSAHYVVHPDAILVHPDVILRARAALAQPKPPSLKEQALTALSHLLSGSAQTLDTTEAEYYIRRALEALPND